MPLKKTKIENAARISERSSPSIAWNDESIIISLMTPIKVPQIPPTIKIIPNNNLIDVFLYAFRLMYIIYPILIIKY